MGESWAVFALAVTLGALLTFAPGYLFFRALRSTRRLALACAPLYSLSIMSILCCVYPFVGIPASPFTVAAVPALVAIALYAASAIAWRKEYETESCKTTPGKRSNAQTPRLDRGAWRNLGLVILYIACGALVISSVILVPQGAADAIVFSPDNIRHYGQIETFSRSSNWSSLDTTLYPPDYGGPIDPFGGESSFYPSAWHTVAALMALTLDISNSLAANATNCLFGAIIYPVSMYLLISTLFPKRYGIISAGALCTSAFTAYPWALLGVWELYPYTASLAITPAVIVSFMQVTKAGVARGQRIVAASGVGLGAISLFFLQPSTVFTAAVFLAPYCVARIAQVANGRRIGKLSPQATKTLLCGGFIAFAAALWIIACKLPIISSAVSYFWWPISDPSSAIADALTLSFAEPMPQIALAALVVAGIVGCLRARSNTWLIASYAIACCMFIIAASGSDTPLKHLVSGMWYTDYYRIAAFAAIFATPLASLGLAWAAQGLFNFLRKPLPNQKLLRTTLVAAAVLAFALANFRPGYTDDTGRWIDSPFAHVRGIVEAHSTTGRDNPYDSAKRDFVALVKETVGEDASILNAPYDGSIYAYSADSLNLHQRYMTGYGWNESLDSVLVRTSLCDISTNDMANEAVKRIGAEYVLVLDRDQTLMSRWFWNYKAEDWKGIEGITDDTPCFETVLAEGDMRLYRILPR